MKKIFAKMRKVRMTRWNKLTFGEKIMKVIMKLVKIAVIVAIVAAVIYGLLFFGMLAIFVFLLLGDINMNDHYRRYW